MKLVVAIIRPETLEAVQKALNSRELHLMTVSEVLDCREDQATVEIYRGRTIRRPVRKLRLEVAVDDALFDATVRTIERVAAREEAGKDEVFVVGLDESFRVGAWG